MRAMQLDTHETFQEALLMLLSRWENFDRGISIFDAGVEDVLPAPDQQESWAVGQFLATPCSKGGLGKVRMLKKVKANTFLEVSGDQRNKMKTNCTCHLLSKMSNRCRTECDLGVCLQEFIATGGLRVAAAAPACPVAAVVHP
eukprot:155319-Pelagomonas_calceolata.AAC.8